MVYVNFFFGKVFKNKAIHWVSCLTQKVSYIIYKKFFLQNLIGRREKIDKIITAGILLLPEKSKIQTHKWSTDNDGKEKAAGHSIYFPKMGE